MVCYAPRLEHETAIETGLTAPAVSRTGPKLFLVREAVAEPYRAKEPGADTPLPASHGDAGPLPEAEVSAALLPESDGDILDALEEEIVVLSAHIHAATHRLLTLIARYDSLRGWELAGHRSCAHWLAYRTGLDLGTAREKVRAARSLERLPETSAAMARGELSFSQLRALSRVATVENEGDLLELARGCTTAQLERMVRAVRKGTEADESEAEKRRYQSRTLSVFPDDDGMYVVRGRLTAEEGALLMRAIEAAGDALYREERWSPAVVKAAAARGHVLEGETEREAAQRRADALGLVAERALAAGFGGRRRRDGSDAEAEGSAGSMLEDAADAQPEDSADSESGGGLPVPISGSRAERYQVVLHVEAETLRRPPAPNPWEHCAGAGLREIGEGTSPLHPSLQAPKSELDDGTRVSHEPSDPWPSRAKRAGMVPRETAERSAGATSRRLSCDASVVRLTKGPDGSILDVGRRTRTISPALRRALEARDRGCRYPGCGSRFTDAHHVIPWAAGGDTSLGNCVLLCKYHHRLVHEGGWTVDWWGEGKPVFYDPRGGVHCEVRWEAPEVGPELVDAQNLGKELMKAPDPGEDWVEAPDPGEKLVEALVEENRQRGVEPVAWALGARWKREEDIPDTVYFSAMEALS